MVTEECALLEGASSAIDPLELEEIKHSEAAVEAALPRMGDDQGREGSGKKFDSFWREIRAAMVGDMGDIADG